jgi:hypothetical protein
MTDGLSGFEKSSENGGRVKIRSVFCIVPFQLDKRVDFRAFGLTISHVTF